MSGLERFQGTSDWIQKFKSLLTNREPNTPPRNLNSSGEDSFGLELSEDFQTILERKNIPTTMTTSFKIDNKENLNPIALKDSKDLSSSKFQIKRISVCEDSIMNPSFIDRSSNSFEITNFSFTTIENACNKSVSDPDSTIHNYVEIIRKNNESKNSNITENSQEETEAIDRLIKDLEAEELKYGLKERNSFPRLSVNPVRTTMGFADQTQLADIEEPSALWETTVTDNNGKYISPTKMVGLLRPSTILEESSSSNLTAESNATENSFNTALKSDTDKTNIESDVTSQYETACESIPSEIGNIQVYNDKKENTNLDSVNQVQNLHDSFSNIQKSLSNISHTTNNVNKVVHLHKTDIKQEKSFIKTQSLEHLNTIEISDDETDEESKDISHEENEELNEGFSIQGAKNNVSLMDETIKEIDSRDDKGLNISREFNDTLEEVEYIMKHGMQMLKDSAKKSKTIEDVNTEQTSKLEKSSISLKSKAISPILNKSPTISKDPLNIINKTKISEKCLYPNSPLHHQKILSPKCNINTPPNKNSPFSKAAVKQFSAKKNPSSAIKDTFKKPVFGGNTSRIPQSKPVSVIKKSFYADVISPVGAYIKKTPVCPTQSKIKETTIKSLDYGQATGKATLQYHPPKRNEIKKGNGPSLPQKCYKSAEYRCVVDERTPLNIPGGEKIHKYLKPALMPSVARHDGKMKMGSPMKYAHARNNDVNKTVDSTLTDLGDLSTMSGDVSIYTLKDAQKFSFVNGNKSMLMKK